MTSLTARAWVGLRRALPEGRELPEDEWGARHRAILWVVFAHAVGVAIFGLYRGFSAPQSLAEGALIGLIGLIAAFPGTKRRFRGAVAALALVTASAVIVQFSGGYIEAHFHFFVVLAVIALYMDWIPFLLAVGYVALDHGIVGTIFPTLVYNHADAYAHPWQWAMIHATLVLGESVALLMGWKVAETARRRTALVLDSAGEGIVGLDLGGKITFANPAAATMTQHEVSALLGKPIDAFVHAATREGSATWGLRAEEGVELARKDGTSLSVEVERTPIRNNDVVIGHVMTLRDVTERKLAEAALRRAVSTLAATLESTTDGILVVDRSGRIAGFNKKFVEMWGVPMSLLHEGDDKLALTFVKEQLQDPDGFVSKVAELYDDAQSTSFDELAFRDGRIFERYSQPQRSGDDVIGRVWSFRDVTERRRAERALQEQRELQLVNERLREMDRLKTQFINNAAHELGTPLTPIKLQAHLLGNEKLGPLTERQRNGVTVLVRNVDQLGRLLRDVLDSARVQSGRLDIAPEPTDMRKLAAEAVESFAEAAAQEGIVLRVEGDPVVVPADAPRVTQVLFNLIRNALKFTPRGGEVVVRVRDLHPGASVEVIDTGAGLRAEDVARLFQPFSQVHDKMEKTRSGAGLGLYVSRGIVESHGGHIGCRSDGPGRGATFAFSLPAQTS
ncbi:MAG: two-component system, NarL family, sensor histidine kinase BarA [Thermoplasmata archaeon]|nr:two-component system, NarL family, sensor histidine kinase BarA [Thermoplasmata archaeon]